MSSISHARDISSDSKASGASYRLILEHILSYPGTYEMPLRSMYTLNCIQPLPQHASRPPTPSTSSSSNSPTTPISPTFPPTHAATAQFTSSLFSHVTRLPSQPCSLPPVFINTFLRRCFPPQLGLVDFPQALFGLDYLKDLETRRRRELAAAFRRLGVQREDLNTRPEDIPRFHPRVAKWVEMMEKGESKVEALYTQVYVSLRRWILINELSLTPFNKHNCLAMLNTLYPPTSTSRPTTKLTTEVLKRQRDTFFRYIQAVERKGPDVLRPLIDQNTNPGDENGWPRVRGILDSYLRVATNIIDECVQIIDLDDFIAGNGGWHVSSKRKDSKADSGVSFCSNDMPSTSLGTDERKRAPDYATTDAPPAKRSYSALEKIAREFRRFRERKKAPDVRRLESEVVVPHEETTGTVARTDTGQVSPQKQESAAMKRLRSLGDLRSLARPPAGGLSRSTSVVQAAPAGLLRTGDDELRNAKLPSGAVVGTLDAPRQTFGYKIEVQRRA